MEIMTIERLSLVCDAMSEEIKNLKGELERRDEWEDNIVDRIEDLEDHTGILVKE